MKDTIKTIIITVLLSISIIIPICMSINFTNAFHVREEKVQVIEANNGEYAVVDEDGEVWEFTSDHTYFKDEVLTIKFDTLGTEIIYDDEIIAVKNNKKRA